MQQAPSLVNVQSVMRDVRRAARRQMLVRGNGNYAARRKVAGSLSPDLTQMRLQIEMLEQGARQLGQMPPTPPTFRARISRMLVQVVHRAVFWIWPPLQQEFDLTARTLQLQLVLHESLMDAVIETREMVERLHHRLDELSDEG